MAPPRRHQLRRLSNAAWHAVLSREWDDEARACIALWSARKLPLIVTRQPVALPEDRLAMGLPAPDGFHRRRIAIDVDADETQLHDGFPALRDVMPSIGESNIAWRALTTSLDALHVDARVYGSHGWQAMTGLDYVHRDSDVDLLMPVTHPAMADAVVDVLAASASITPRLDGELIFPDDAGIAWREWPSRQAGRGVLVKRLSGARIESFMLESTEC